MYLPLHTGSTSSNNHIFRIWSNPFRCTFCSRIHRNIYLPLALLLKLLTCLGLDTNVTSLCRIELVNYLKSGNLDGPCLYEIEMDSVFISRIRDIEEELIHCAFVIGSFCTALSAC